MSFHRSSAAIAAFSVLFAASSLADQPPASPSAGKLPTLRLASARQGIFSLLCRSYCIMIKSETRRLA